MNNRIFIGGYMHSGTSLLQKILGNHTDIFTPEGEIKFFEFLPTLKKEFSISNDSEKMLFAGFCNYLIKNGVPYSKLKSSKNENYHIPINIASLSDYNSHTEIFSLVLDCISEEENKTNWLEKSPNNIFFYKEIADEIQNTKVLLIVRDPRDVLTSKKIRRMDISKKFDQSKLKLKGLEKKYSPLIDSYSWASSAKMIINLHAKYPDNTLIIKYEDLISQPESMIQTICNFLNLNYQDSLLDISFSNSADNSHKSSGIYSNSGNFKKILTNTEIIFIESNLKNLFEEFNYKFYSKKRLFGLIKSFRFYLTGVYDVIDRLISRFRLFGPSYFVSFLLLTFRKLKGILR